MPVDDQFPRTNALPKQTALFWVTHKDRYLRQLLIADIEKLTNRSLLVYFTDVDNSSAQIDVGDDQILAELLSESKLDGVDLLIETRGGETDATEKICSLLRSLAPDLRVIVPRRAKSNGTVIALTGSTILMSATSELGPIDPSVLDMPAEFILKDPDAYNKLIYRFAESASLQTKKLATSLLTSGMMKAVAPAVVDGAVNKLATRDCYASHGSVIDSGEAKALGLDVTYLEPESELWKKIWLLRTMYAYDCPRNGYAKIFESLTVSSAVAAKAAG